MNSNVCQANVRQSVQANTLTTRSGNGYKRSGVHTPNNVREFKRFATTVQTSRRRQGVFVLTFMANIQRTAYSRPCSLYTSHLQFLQWSCYICSSYPPSDSLPSLVVESAELFHRNTHNQLGDVGEISDPHIKILLAQ